LSEERLLTISDVVQRLALSRSTVMGLLGEGDLPSLTIRRSRRVRESALHDFIEARAAEEVNKRAKSSRGVGPSAATEGAPVVDAGRP
jgi:excisionase family DNA binding protein